MPRISVVIASYNHENYVQATLESVLAQSFQDFEIQVTDDGSQDRTVAEVPAVADARISLVSLPRNCGACVALNASIQRATGEYIAILNSDNVFLPGKLAKQIRYLDDNVDVAAVFTRPMLLGENGRPYTGAEHKDSTLLEATNRQRHEWLRHFFFHGNALCHPSLLIRRSCYDEVGLYNPALAQVPDLEMWVRLLRRYDIHLIEEPLVGFRIRDNHMNASAARPEVLVRDQWEWRRVLEEYLYLDDAMLTKVFPELAGLTGRSELAWKLAELALEVGRPAHVLFALDTMYGALADAPNPMRYRQFIALTGSYDPYGVLCEVPAHRKIVAPASQDASAAPRFMFDGPRITFDH